MTLIHNASQWWRMWSVRFASLILVWTMVPAEHQSALLALLGVPADLIPGALAALVLLSRLIAQPALQGGSDAERPE